MKVISPKSVDGSYDVFHMNNTTYIICPYTTKLTVNDSTEIICPDKHVRIYYVYSFNVVINGNIIVPNVYDIPRKELAFSTLEKNSSELLYHWLTYHSLLGADFFFIYDNNSLDEEFEKIVKVCEKFEGIIFRWNYPYGYSGPTQQTQQNHTLYLTRNNIKRIALTDLDEYIVPYETANFKEIIKSKIVYMWWLWFGNCDSKTSKDPRLYTKCSLSHETKWYHKMIIDPSYVDLVSAHNVLLPSISESQIKRPKDILLHHYVGLSYRGKCKYSDDCDLCKKYNYELSNIYSY